MESVRTDRLEDTEVLFILVRAGLWEKVPENLSLFPRSSESWERIFNLAQRQTVTGLVYQGLCQLPDELLPPEQQLLHWVATIDRIERANLRMNRVLTELYELFHTNGLHPVLQKGQGIARFYEKPLLRECGDIDFYFSDKEESRQAASLVSQMGCRVSPKADDSLCYYWKGVNVEHHTRLTDLHSPFIRKYLYKQEQDPANLTSFRLPGNPTEITIPSPLLNLVLLNTHIMKHAFGWGIGLRQLCDLARAYHCLYLEVNLLMQHLKTVFLLEISKMLRLQNNFKQVFVPLLFRQQDMHSMIDIGIIFGKIMNILTLIMEAMNYM